MNTDIVLIRKLNISSFVRISLPEKQSNGNLYIVKADIREMEKMTLLAVMWKSVLTSSICGFTKTGL